MGTHDFFDLSKILPISKLADLLSRSMGRLFKAYFDKKDVDTKAYEIEKIAAANAEKMRVISSALRESAHPAIGIEYNDEGIVIKLQASSPERSSAAVGAPCTLEARTHNRIQFQELKRQLNIESITAIAAEDLKQDKEVTPQPPDEDWATRFFRIAEDISNEEMQMLWGKILAGEIRRPGSFSRRTLELLQYVSREEAEIFKKFAAFAITACGKSFLLNFEQEELLTEKYEFSYNERLILEELGILSSHDLCFTIPASQEKKMQCGFVMGGTVVVADLEEHLPEHNIKVLAFTKLGQELIALVKSTPKFDYIKLLASKIKRKGVTIKYGKIRGQEAKDLHYDELGDISLDI